MTGRISVIIPTLNEAQTIQTCLRQFDQLSGTWEILVADSGSSDGTRECAARRPGVRVLDAPRGRGAAMNYGAGEAHGDVLLFLHADTLLPRNAWSLINDALGDPRVCATAFQIRLDRTELMYGMVRYASRIRVPIQRTFFGDQAIAVRRQNFIRIGGYRDLPLMEDVDVSHRLRALGTLKLLPAEVVTSARRFERNGVIRTLMLMTGLQLAYACGVSPDRLARWYAFVR